VGRIRVDGEVPTENNERPDPNDRSDHHHADAGDSGEPQTDPFGDALGSEHGKGVQTEKADLGNDPPATSVGEVHHTPFTAKLDTYRLRFLGIRVSFVVLNRRQT
jgi:hypothetical protein